MSWPPSLPGFRAAYRVVAARHAPFDGAGAMFRGGRWNSRGRAVIYCAGTYAGALLEILTRLGVGEVRGIYHAVEAQIPEDLTVETITEKDAPTWDATDRRASRALGDAWLDRGSSAVLVVPSMTGRPFERNVVVNPAHRDAKRILVGAAVPVVWDARLTRG